ncbi:hypothetical protein E1264_28480 [Actinomadura sp. KC216]|nr:hypothetical protein E1264_28480 [Actinomadura sp. KC216]
MDLPADERNPTLIQAAKAICDDCPVLDHCREWVLALAPRDDPGGICGGLTEPERAARRKVTVAADVPDGHKWCRRCLDVKPLEAFYRDRKNADGRNSFCKACNSRIKTARYHATKGAAK